MREAEAPEGEEYITNKIEEMAEEIRKLREDMRNMGREWEGQIEDMI